MACVSVPVLTTMAETAGAGALGGAVLGAKSGNSLKDALMGGVLGGLGGEAYGAYGAVGDTAAADAGVQSGVGQSFDAAGDSVAAGSPDAVSMGTSAPGVVSSGSGAGVSASNAASGAGKGILGLNTSNPLNDVMAGSVGLGAVSSLLPKKQVNVGQNAANVMATNPNFSNPNLPQYTMQNTAAPYAGNWYTYGQNPQVPLYNAQPQAVANQTVTPAKTGGLMKYAQGGIVHGYASGGMPNPLVHTPMSGAMGGVPMVSNQPVRRFAAGGAVPQGGSPMPPQGMPPQMPMGAPPLMQQPQQVQKPVNPLALKAAHKIGVAIGQHLRNRGMTPDGIVKGTGGGQDDVIPARLSQDEFVVPADVVAHLGDGSSNEGGKKLNGMLHKVRAHKTKNGSKFPPRAKNPLSYLSKTART